MNRTETYSGFTAKDRSRAVKDLDIWVANSLATILAGLGIASGIIGLLVAFGYINGDAVNSFQDGMVWMVGGLILTIAANVFRREHHLIDSDSLAGRPLSGGSMGRGYSDPPLDDRARSEGTHADVRRTNLDDDIRHK